MHEIVKNLDGMATVTTVAIKCMYVLGLYTAKKYVKIFVLY